MKKLLLKKEAEKRVKNGYLWIQRNWIKEIDEIAPGEHVKILSEKGEFIASAYANPSSFITARIYSFKDEDLNEDLIADRIAEALNLRKRLNIKSNAYRIFFSEGDGLPGLIIDKYKDSVVFQILTAGLERIKESIINVIDRLLSPQQIIERKDAPGRVLEGLDYKGAEIIKSKKSHLEERIQIEEYGVSFWVDLIKGHKTGHYLDQRENREEISHIASGNVLDCFCNTGGFGIYCAKKGNCEVIGIDISSYMIELAEENAKLNNVEDRITFVKGNVFEYLRILEKRGKKFDMVILDPPSFTKSKRTVKNALRGYKEINLRGIKILKKGGLLVTASCSHHVTLDLFLQTLKSALKDSKRKGKIVSVRYQAKDHPFLIEMPETLYLKLVIIEVL